MSELPVMKLRELLSTLSKNGFVVVSQKGSHLKLKKKVGQNTFIVIIPAHDEIRRGTLKSIISQAGYTKEEFMKLLNG